MKALLHRLFFWVHALVPKFNHAVVYGGPDFEDTTLALAWELERTTVRSIIVFVTGKAAAAPPCALPPKARVVRKNSVAGLAWFLTARAVFFTHRCFALEFPRRVVSVNIWHGMPIKRIGRMLPGGYAVHSRYAVATSAFWQPVIRQSMEPFGPTLACGLPRNDRLFCDPAATRRKAGIPAETRHLIAWLPTYRQSVTGEIRTDGQESGSAFGIAGIDTASLEALLARHRAVLLLKPHPMTLPVEAGGEGPLILADEAWLAARSLSLYEFLGACDLLISDISSVIVDWLILGRPVLHSFPDLAPYMQSRGFSISPIADYFGGPVATNAAELMQELERFFAGHDTHAAKRKELQTLFHAHADAHASRRLLEAVGLLAQE
jgi:CDP-glycerol glycerophosphotransferase (TagB/SpsB family)